jgi:hypothetical protein
VKSKRTVANILTLALAVVLMTGISLAQEPQPQESTSPQAQMGTGFTYQGRLTDGGSPADGEYDLQFYVYDALSGGSWQAIVTKENVLVDEGLFAVLLNFGPGIFTGQARYLEIRVRPGSSTGAYTTLIPRQALTPAPYALALPGLWTEQNATSPNLIGGYHGNDVASDVVGATIGGGGAADDGSGNPIPNNVTDNYGTVGGGGKNQAGNDSGTTSDASYATVSGGLKNTASHWYTSIGGGAENAVSGVGGTVGGGIRNAASDVDTTVCGGVDNAASGFIATVGGGDTNIASGDYATAGGGQDNTASGDHSTVSGGSGNSAASMLSTVGGGMDNTASGQFSIIGGGQGNTVTANSNHTTVAGGAGNTSGAPFATVGGGQGNMASGNHATVAGGNTNVAVTYYATVGGGQNNVASGDYSTVPGGSNNSARNFWTFAAGRNAKANNIGCFVWGDGSTGDIECNVDHRWVARTSGGVYYYTNAGLTSGVYVAAGGNSWNSISDRATKENFSLVDGQAVLEQLAAMPIQEYNLKSQDASIRHVGPVAQDFYAAFGYGESDLAINMEDADGVALAAIQSLYELNQEQATRIESLEVENAAQQAQIDALAARIDEIEAAVPQSETAARPLQSQRHSYGIGLLPGIALFGMGLVWVARRRETR